MLNLLALDDVYNREYFERKDPAQTGRFDHHDPSECSGSDRRSQVKLADNSIFFFPSHVEYRVFSVF